MDNVTVAAVCYVEKTKADNMANKYNCNAYYDYEQMIECENLDSVHICLPHYLHGKASIYALSHGVDVLCEKPIDVTYAAGLLMKATAEKFGRKLGIVFQNRYNYGVVRFKRLLDDGKLGKILGMTGILSWKRGQDYYDSANWRGKWATEGGGVLINQAIHTLDLMCYLANSNTESVSTNVSHFGSTTVEVEDTADGIIKFQNGIICNFYFTNTAAANNEVMIIINCENARAVITGTSIEITYDNGTVENSEKTNNIIIGKSCYGLGHFNQIGEFYSGGGKEKADFMLNEAPKTQELLEKIYAASNIKRF